VRLIVGLAAGGVQDIVARLIGQWLSERLGQSFVVENRTGAGGNTAAETVVRATPDGYTLLLVGPPNAINASLYEGLPFNFSRDIAPVASISREPQLMLVNPSVPAETVPEFIAYAKANPGKLNMASAGIGSGPHLSGELFKMLTGVNIVHIPYRGGGPALTDLISGRVHVMFSAMAASIAHARAGKLRPLAITTATRSDMLPELPTVGDFVAGYEASAFIGIGAPRNTPAEIVNKLNNEINAAFADPKVGKRFAELGGTALPGSPTDFRKLLANETEKWAKVVKFAGINAK
jgi:tripartite-type tricarboxylate transporter receptor subunit TctC